MARKGWRTVAIREELLKKALESYEEFKKDRPYTAFTDYINNLLWSVLEEDRYLSRYAPGLQFIGLDQNVVYVKDHFIDRIVEVEIHDEGISKRFLYCRYCERDDCLHVGFCFAIREVNKILVERGFKQPKASK
ncbi:MAG: hypothetical protein QXM92_01980 [Candidatus Anstonellales archaeon]